MPVEGIIEEDEEGELVIVLREKDESMTAREKFFKKFERNMCPADIYDPHSPPQKKRLDNDLTI